MREPLADRTHGKWPSLLPLVGISSQFLTGKHGPCPLCKGGKDRWRFTDHNGDGGWVCNQCGSGFGIELVKRFHGIEFKEAAERIEAVIGKATEEPKRKTKSKAEIELAMRSLWSTSQPLTKDCFAARYLANRGIDLDRFPTTLAFVRDGWWDRQTHCGAMIAKVTDHDGYPVNIHRTFIMSDGKKANLDPVRKLMKGALPDGSAVRLGKPGSVLGIAEGIETALAASILFQTPVWAALAAQNLAKFTPPFGVKTVLICGDNDESFTGQAASYALAKKMRAKGIDVRVEIPPTIGQDWNDVLVGR